MERKPTTGELFCSATCPLDCEYCYIPKTEKMQNLHGKIENKIEKGEYIDQLEDFYGKDLRHLGLWGAEPLVGLEKLAGELEELSAKFPKLKDIKLSTSLQLDPQPLIKFIEKANKEGIHIGVQISIDGQYTDKNRGKDSLERIECNLKKLLKSTSGKEDYHVQWKSTLTLENLREMKEKKEIEEYFNYFSKLNNKAKKWADNAEIRENTFLPTLAVPGKYTKKDGEVLAEFMKNIRENGFHTTYKERIKRIYDHPEKVMKNPRHLTCSAGDTSFGFDGEDIHICHRSFFVNNKEYAQSLQNQNIAQNWDISAFESGQIKNIRNNYVIESEEDRRRLQYIMSSYHDFLEFRVAHEKAVITEMADLGQVRDEYKHNEELKELLGVFLHTSVACHLENLLNTGTPHFQVASLLRLWGNGAFKQLLKSIEEERGQKCEQRKIQ
ncbi:MAG: radical SAM protein [Candidatus Nanohaloarchaeota archaeon QJJ-9]|nr:radical SAM protein [Candidatus Nanohaloarchaeota archaeon QJJ-9]